MCDRQRHYAYTPAIPVSTMQTHETAAMNRHPASDQKRRCAYPHVIVSRQGLVPTKLDEQLALLKRERRIGLVVPSFSAVPALLLKSDLIAMLPTKCLPKSAGDVFASFALPIQVDGFAIHVAWHARSDTDPIIRYVASAIRKILA